MDQNAEKKGKADQLVACRMTSFERSLVEAVATRRRTTLSEVVRDAVMSRVRQELEDDRQSSRLGAPS